jgi:broad specificity phosphatase PhoE
MNSIVKDNRLRDTDSTWEGTMMDEFLRIFTQGNTFADPRTLETLEQLGERMKAAYDEIGSRFEGKRIGIISHGDPLRALWFRLSNPQGKFPPYRELTKLISLDAAQGMRIQADQRGGSDVTIELI